MEIPKSLQPVWAEAIKDNKITQQEYKKLIDVAAPNKKNEEFEDDEINFLGEVQKGIQEKGFVTGNIPDEFKAQDLSKQVSGKTTTSTSKEQSFDLIGNLGNASNSWTKKYPGKSFPREQIFYVTKDGNLISQ